MPLFYRRLIFSGFVLLFCILVPVVLIYATGNNINWSRLSLEKTGSILIDSSPAGATVFLNGQKINDNFFGIIPLKNYLLTKAKITDLVPGEYTIKLEKNGYWPWEEKFRLSPDEVSNFGTIGLFVQTTPNLVYETNKTTNKLSPDGGKIALIKKDLINIIDVNNSKNKEIRVNDINLSADIYWSHDNKYLAIGKNIVDVDKGMIINLAEETGKDISSVRWGNNEGIVYFISNKKILRYTLSSKNITELSLNSQLKGQNIIDYLIINDKIYIITTLNNQQKLLIGSIEGQLTSIDLPAGSYKFKNDLSPKPVLTNGDTTYVIDEPLAIFSKPRLLEISNNLKLGVWENNSLTYSNGLELRRWDKEGQEYLMTRFGSNINSLWPIYSRNSVIIATPEDIRVYVNGSQPFAITLATIKNSNLVVVSKDAKTLYVYGIYDNREGLFKLGL